MIYDQQYTSGGVGPPPSLTFEFMSGAALDPRITFTRASTVATYFDAAGVMRTAGYNQVRNSTMAGAVVGSPGTYPTNWILTNPVTGVVVSIVATGTEDGLPYIDVSFVGTASVTATVTVSADVTNYIVAATGQSWTNSVYTKLIAGTVVGTLGTAMSARISAGGFGADYTAQIFPTSAPLGQQRTAAIANPISQASIAFVQPKAVYLSLNNGQTVNFTLRIAGPQIEQTASASSYAPTTGAATGAPRFDYDPVTHAPRGLLIEEPRTNQCFPSIPGAGWSPQAITIVQNSGIAPDGTNALARMFEAAVTSFHTALRYPNTITASTTQTFSVYAKAGEVQYLQLVLDDNAAMSVDACFDLVNGTISSPARLGGGATNGASFMQAVGNGIYRCGVTAQIGSVTSVRVAVGLSNVPVPGKFVSYPGNTANGLYAWGAQLEQGAFVTSHIPTVGATVTRAVDVPTFASGAWRNSSAETWNAEAVVIGGGNANPRILGSAAAQHAMIFQNTTTLRGGNYDNAGGANTPNSLPSLGSLAKIAATWTGPNLGTVCMNGGPLGSASTMTNGFSSVLTIRIFGDGTTPDQGSGWIRAIRYWPRVLNASELQQLTL